MRVGPRAYARFPGRPAVLKALRAAGTWTPSDAAAWGRSNGGTAKTYAALAHHVAYHNVVHHPKTDDAPERWTAITVTRRYNPAETQIVGV